MRLFGEAAARNQRAEIIRQALAVSLGIRDALGAGKLLQAWLEDLPEVPAPANKSLSPATAKFFGGAPVIEVKR